MEQRESSRLLAHISTSRADHWRRHEPWPQCRPQHRRTSFLHSLYSLHCDPSNRPHVALLLNKPDRVQRKDGKTVKLEILQNPWVEMKKTARRFLTKNFLLVVPFIGQAVFAEAGFFTYFSCGCIELIDASGLESDIVASMV